MPAIPSKDVQQIALRRKALGLRVDDLARMTGYPRTRVSKVLNGWENSRPLMAKMDEVLTRVEREEAA
jgi:transcriptional regulator with XRE-family HTH domain